MCVGDKGQVEGGMCLGPEKGQQCWDLMDFICLIVHTKYILYFIGTYVQNKYILHEYEADILFLQRTYSYWTGKPKYSPQKSQTVQN